VVGKKAVDRAKAISSLEGGEGVSRISEILRVGRNLAAEHFFSVTGSHLSRGKRPIKKKKNRSKNAMQV